MGVKVIKFHRTEIYVSVTLSDKTNRTLNKQIMIMM